MINYSVFGETGLNHDLYSVNVEEKLINEAIKVNELRAFYSDSFIIFLKKLIIGNGLTYEDIIDKLPSSKLIDADEHRFNMIKHIFGIKEEGMPVSYMMLESMILNGNLDNFEDQMYYYTVENAIKVPFTKEEFKLSMPIYKEKVKKHITI